MADTTQIRLVDSDQPVLGNGIGVVSLRLPADPLRAERLMALSVTEYDQRVT